MVATGPYHSEAPICKKIYSINLTCSWRPYDAIDSRLVESTLLKKKTPLNHLNPADRILHKSPDKQFNSFYDRFINNNNHTGSSVLTPNQIESPCRLNSISNGPSYIGTLRQKSNGLCNRVTVLFDKGAQDIIQHVSKRLHLIPSEIIQLENELWKNYLRTYDCMKLAHDAGRLKYILHPSVLTLFEYYIMQTQINDISSDDTSSQVNRHHETRLGEPLTILRNLSSINLLSNDTTYPVRQNHLPSSKKTKQSDLLKKKVLTRSDYDSSSLQHTSPLSFKPKSALQSKNSKRSNTIQENISSIKSSKKHLTKHVDSVRKAKSYPIMPLMNRNNIGTHSKHSNDSSPNRYQLSQTPSKNKLKEKKMIDNIHCELNNNNEWIIEDQKGTLDLCGTLYRLLGHVESSHSIIIRNSANFTFECLHTIDHITLDHCDVVNLVLQNVTTLIDIHDCSQLKIQILGLSLNFDVKNTNGITVYLSVESRYANFITTNSKSLFIETSPVTSTGILLPDDDLITIPLPQSYITIINPNTNKIQTRPLEQCHPTIPEGPFVSLTPILESFGSTTKLNSQEIDSDVSSPTLGHKHRSGNASLSSNAQNTKTIELDQRTKGGVTTTGTVNVARQLSQKLQSELYQAKLQASTLITKHTLDNPNKTTFSKSNVLKIDSSYYPSNHLNSVRVEEKIPFSMIHPKKLTSTDQLLTTIQSLSNELEYSLTKAKASAKSVKTIFQPVDPDKNQSTKKLIQSDLNGLNMTLSPEILRSRSSSQDHIEQIILEESSKTLFLTDPTPILNNKTLLDVNVKKKVPSVPQKQQVTSNLLSVNSPQISGQIISQENNTDTYQKPLFDNLKLDSNQTKTKSMSRDDNQQNTTSPPLQPLQKKLASPPKKLGLLQKSSSESPKLLPSGYTKSDSSSYNNKTTSDIKQFQDSPKHSENNKVSTLTTKTSELVSNPMMKKGIPLDNKTDGVPKTLLNDDVKEKTSSPPLQPLQKKLASPPKKLGLLQKSSSESPKLLPSGYTNSDSFAYNNKTTSDIKQFQDSPKHSENNKVSTLTTKTSELVSNPMMKKGIPLDNKTDGVPKTLLNDDVKGKTSSPPLQPLQKKLASPPKKLGLLQKSSSESPKLLPSGYTKSDSFAYNNKTTSDIKQFQDSPKHSENNKVSTLTTKTSELVSKPMMKKTVTLDNQMKANSEHIDNNEDSNKNNEESLDSLKPQYKKSLSSPKIEALLRKYSSGSRTPLCVPEFINEDSGQTLKKNAKQKPSQYIKRDSLNNMSSVIRDNSIQNKISPEGLAFKNSIELQERIPNVSRPILEQQSNSLILPKFLKNKPGSFAKNKQPIQDSNLNSSNELIDDEKLLMSQRLIDHPDLGQHDSTHMSLDKHINHSVLKSKSDINRKPSLEMKIPIKKLPIGPKPILTSKHSFSELTHPLSQNVSQTNFHLSLVKTDIPIPRSQQMYIESQSSDDYPNLPEKKCSSAKTKHSSFLYRSSDSDSVLYSNRTDKSESNESELSVVFKAQLLQQTISLHSNDSLTDHYAENNSHHNLTHSQSKEDSHYSSNIANSLSSDRIQQYIFSTSSSKKSSVSESQHSSIKSDHGGPDQESHTHTPYSQIDLENMLNDDII